MYIKCFLYSISAASWIIYEFIIETGLIAIRPKDIESDKDRVFYAIKGYMANWSLIET